MKLYLLRHPRVSVPKTICYGRTDVALADGYDTAVAAVRPLLPIPADLDVYCSPASRCRLVLDHLSGYPKASVDPRLQELDFGSWENRPWPDLPENELRPWSENFAEIAPPGGETVNQMAARAMDFWAEVTARDRDALVVTHTGWIRVLLARLLETSVQRAFRLKIDFLGLTLIQKRGDWTEIHYINRVGDADQP